MIDEQKSDSAAQKEQSENETAILAQAKAEHKGRYPKALAERTKSIKAKQKRDGTIVLQSKLDLFMAEFLRNGGNATSAAEKIFNCKSRTVAASIGAHYLAQGKQLGRIVMEEKGYHYGKMIEVAGKKMEESKTPEWWDRLMKIGGYEDFMTKQGPTPTTVNVLSVQKELLDEYVDGEYIDDEEQ